jgi:hypothetical protein
MAGKFAVSGSAVAVLLYYADWGTVAMLLAPAHLGLASACFVFLLSYNKLAQKIAILRRAPGPLAVLVVGTLVSFLFEPIALGPEPYPLVAAVRRPTATIDQSILSQGDHVQDGRFDLSRPGFGQRNLRNRLRPRHDLFPGNAVLRLPERLA